MGNRIVLEALSRNDSSMLAVVARLGQLIFAAADENAETFKTKFSSFKTAGMQALQV